MATTAKEAVMAVRSQCGVAHAALVMAVATIAERIRNLPRPDQDDLYALMKDLPGADGEELESIMTAALEILEQAPGRVLTCEQEPEPTPGEPLSRWLAWVSERIHAERKKAGLTQVELAEKAGLPQSHISRLEGGKHSPSRATLEKIAAALGVEVGVFDPSA
jgi:DNA-binding XRE family transcriptional regulator